MKQNYLHLNLLELISSTRNRNRVRLSITWFIYIFENLSAIQTWSFLSTDYKDVVGINLHLNSSSTAIRIPSFFKQKTVDFFFLNSYPANL